MNITHFRRLVNSRNLLHAIANSRSNKYHSVIRNRNIYIATTSYYNERRIFPKPCVVNSALICKSIHNFSTTANKNNQTEFKTKPIEETHQKRDKNGKTTKKSEPQADVGTKKTEEENADDSKSSVEPPKEEKLSMTAKFKKMYKEYWYVLLPVHLVTSSIWLGGFYYLSTSGVDIPSLLESMHFSESIISKLRDSSLGHLAIAYMCYKIATPLRYTVTLGGTTLAIKYLSQWGYIRPMPSKEKLKEIYRGVKKDL